MKKNYKNTGFDKILQRILLLGTGSHTGNVVNWNYYDTIEKTIDYMNKFNKRIYYLQTKLSNEKFERLKGRIFGLLTTSCRNKTEIDKLNKLAINFMGKKLYDNTNFKERYSI